MILGDNTWEVVDQFDRPDTEQMLNALMKGANALSLKIEKPLTLDEKSEILEGIDVSMISFYLKGSMEGIASFIDPEMNCIVPVAYREKLTSLGKNLTFHTFTFENINFEEEAIAFLNECRDKVQLPICIIYHINNNYLQNIINLRVIRLLWAHLIASYAELSGSLKILAASKSYPDETAVEEDLVYATIHLMSSIIGSADGILLKISEKQGHSESFKARITRNLHHLAVYEAGMSKIRDPLQGSYYIEEKTSQMAKEAWNKFIA